MHVVYHVAAVSFVACCCWMALRRPQPYSAVMQEDRLVEWMSVFVFTAAGIIALANAIRSRRVFDALVGAFLLFVAGEEMSWGQRLFGVMPPALFLEHNTQQEMNVHNFADLFGSPKRPFMLVLAGYGVALPVVWSFSKGRALLARIGATPPPRDIAAWFVIAIVLLIWYPFRFTGEWTELLAGSAFLVATGASSLTLAALAPAGLAFAWAMTTFSARGSGDPARLTCAANEADAIAGVLRGELAASGNLHKRVWTLVEEGRVPAELLRRALGLARCEGNDASPRRQYAIDPWGTAYWVRVRDSGGATGVIVYSFGPNRRRDGDRSGGDDIVSRESRP